MIACVGTQFIAPFFVPIPPFRKTTAGKQGVMNAAPTENNDMAAGAINHAPCDGMAYNPDIHHRRSIRLKDYDYSQAGAYFVTICTENRECLFGDISGGEMRLNDAGRMVEITWNDLPGHNDNILLDSFIIMPNHIHGIITIRGGFQTRPC